MLIRFEMGFFFSSKILRIIEEKDLYRCNNKENVKKLTVLK
jgi:hypothetical protein